MKLVRSLRRTWARASFATVIPAAAFGLGMVLSSTFTAYYFAEASRTYHATNKVFAERMADAIAADAAAGDFARVDTLLSSLSPNRAILLDTEDNRQAGSISAPQMKPARHVPVIYKGEQVATLVAAPTTSYRPPMPYLMALALILLVSVIAAGVMRRFAKLASNYIQRVTKIVNDFTLQSSANYVNSNLVFAEFRTLNVATVRTTRRLVREIRTLRDRAQYDVRTGLLNEHSLHRHIETTLVQARFDNPSALIVIELNDYSRFAERAGNSYSDTAIKAISEVFKATVRQAEQRRSLVPGTWTLASLHSDQFAILVRDYGARDDLASFVRDLQMAFRSPVAVGERTFAVSLSGSIVIIPEDGDSVALIRQRADATIVDLKRQEKRGFSFYSPKLERQRDALVKLETELRTAVNEDRFVPLFQPKIDLQTGRICGAEALARWRLDSGRLVAPSVFIELAEETGLINSIGEQIMRKACVETAQWNQLGHRLSVAVNVSPKQFEREGLSHMILDALARSGLSPRQLEIEITESLAIQQPERVRSVLKPLRKLGIKLAVDDFGTGHSNLATLTQLDFDVFKIDRQFVAGTPHDGQANAIVEMILSMASTLEMQIVGEGIETDMQAKFLTEKGCHIGQGYLYSPPVTAEAFRQMLADQPFVASRLIA